jgi:hypothetical protein
MPVITYDIHHHVRENCEGIIITKILTITDLIQILCFCTLSIVLFLSKTLSYFNLKMQHFED